MQIPRVGITKIIFEVISFLIILLLSLNSPYFLCVWNNLSNYICILFVIRYIITTFPPHVVILLMIYLIYIILLFFISLFLSFYHSLKFSWRFRLLYHQLRVSMNRSTKKLVHVKKWGSKGLLRREIRFTDLNLLIH